MEVSKNSSSIVNEALEFYEQAHWAVVAKRVRGRKKAINNVGGQGGDGQQLLPRLSLHLVVLPRLRVLWLGVVPNIRHLQVTGDR